VHLRLVLGSLGPREFDPKTALDRSVHPKVQHTDGHDTQHATRAATNRIDGGVWSVVAGSSCRGLKSQGTVRCRDGTAAESVTCVLVCGRRDDDKVDKLAAPTALNATGTPSSNALRTSFVSVRCL